MMEWLKKILDNATVTDGVLDADALREAIEKEFPKHAVPKAEFNELNEKLKTANTTIENLKKTNEGNETLQKEINGYKTKIKQLETDAVNTQKEIALKDQLREAGVADADYIIYKQGGLDKFTFTKEGKPVGIEEILNPLKESSPHLFKQEPQKSGYDPQAGEKPAVKNPFAKETFNMTEQGRMLRENPEQARQLAAAAGVVI